MRIAILLLNFALFGCSARTGSIADVAPHVEVGLKQACDKGDTKACVDYQNMLAACNGQSINEALTCRSLEKQNADKAVY
jgi:hypothetical protein